MLDERIVSVDLKEDESYGEYCLTIVELDADGNEIKELFTDGGEPEDQTLGRDLNELYVIIDDLVTERASLYKKIKELECKCKRKTG